MAIMKDADPRAEVDGLMPAGPLPARALGLLGRSLLPALAWGARHHRSPRMQRLCPDYLDHIAVPLRPRLSSQPCAIRRPACAATPSTH